MKPKADLHELIEALTKSEKRYFNLFAKRHVIAGENKYTKLFNGIGKQEEYDEPEIIRTLYKGKKPANFAAEKGYLKELILKSLKQFHEKNMVESVLFDRLIQLEILYEKGLFRTGYDLLQKAIVLASEHEKYVIQAELLIWKVNFEIKLNQVDLLSDNIHSVNINLNLFLESTKYMQGFYELFLVNAKSGIANDSVAIQQTVSRFESLAKQPVPNSSIGAYYYYAIHSILALLQGSTEGMALNFEKCLKLFKNNPIFCSDEPNLYLKAANNYILSLIETEDLKMAEAEIRSLQTISGKLALTEQLKARAFIYISDTYLCVLCRQNKVAQAYEESKEIEKKIEGYEKYFEKGRKADLYFSLSNACFFAKDYKSAHKHLNKVLKAKGDKNIDPGLIALAMLVQLLTMIHSNDRILFVNRLNAARKFIKLNVRSPFMLSFCEYLGKAGNGKSDRKGSGQQNNLVNRLIAESEGDASLKRLFGYFDLVHWLKRNERIKGTQAAV